eukprot:5011355-Pleurochrysis_carterae.AAC.2
MTTRIPSSIAQHEPECSKASASIESKVNAFEFSPLTRWQVCDFCFVRLRALACVRQPVRAFAGVSSCSLAFIA